MDEFSLIRTIFQQPALEQAGAQAELGIGDDCALLSIPECCVLAQSIDTLVANVHFPAGGDPFLIGYRALAVSVSDLAAMGALPHSFLLALSLPDNNEAWLKGFATGLAAMAQQAGISLIGGDTTRGPLTITVHVQGLVAKDKALCRSGARPGDGVYVSGFLGEARAALPYILGQKSVATQAEQRLVDRYWRPTPRLDLGLWLAEHGASAALDISDGLAGDLRHILTASNCGAQLFSDQLPISPALRDVCSPQARDYVLQGGDDYELCFTWPQSLPCPTTLLPEGFVPVHKIGEITADLDLRLDGKPYSAKGYQHFE